jgi:hypothetical protein
LPAHWASKAPDTPLTGNESLIPPIINQLALTDDVEGFWSMENHNPTSAKAFLHDQDPLLTFV